ncbi:prepilin-type N-terminal cleavage/methylation domain-containing protein [Nitrospirota bacterium]
METICIFGRKKQISKDSHPAGEPDHPQSFRFSAFAVLKYSFMPRALCLRRSDSCNKRSSAGFSLLEVIVALAILSVAIVAIMELMGTSLRTVRKAEDYSRALLYGRALMEHAYATNDPEELEGIFDYEDGFSAELDTVKIEGDSEVGEFPMYEVSVTVHWPPTGKLTLVGTKAVYDGDEE